MDVLTGLQSFKIVFDSVRALSEITDETKRALAINDILGKLGQAQGALLDCQQNRQALADQNRALEAELARMRDWKEETARYELREHGSNRVLAYAMKAEQQGLHPPHSLCPDCLADTKKSILQPVRHFLGRSESLFCNRCGWEAYTEGHLGEGERPTKPKRR